MIKHLTAGIQGLSNVPAAAQGDSGMATEETQILFISPLHRTPLCPLKGRIIFDYCIAVHCT